MLIISFYYGELVSGFIVFLFREYFQIYVCSYINVRIRMVMIHTARNTDILCIYTDIHIRIYRWPYTLYYVQQNKIHRVLNGRNVEIDGCWTDGRYMYLWIGARSKYGILWIYIRFCFSINITINIYYFVTNINDST